MLQDAEEAVAEKNDVVEEDDAETPVTQTKRKAKTKFGSKKKKKKTKTTSKFPGGDEDGYEVNTVSHFFIIFVYGFVLVNRPVFASLITRIIMDFTDGSSRLLRSLSARR